MLFLFWLFLLWLFLFWLFLLWLLLFLFLFLCQSRGRGHHHYLHSLSLQIKKQKKGGKNVVVATTRPNEQYLEVAAKKTEAPLLCAPLGGGGVLNVLGQLAESESTHLCGVGFDTSGPHFEGCSRCKHSHDRSHDLERTRSPGFNFHHLGRWLREQGC